MAGLRRAPPETVSEARFNGMGLATASPFLLTCRGCVCLSFGSRQRCRHTYARFTMNSLALSAAAVQRGGMYPTICGCCHQLFHARSVLAVWCSDACRRRAGYYRRSGRSIPPKGSKWTQVVQAEILLAAPAVASLDVRSWNGTPISRRADGYVNATAMCQANGKRWTLYQANDRTQSYIAALAADVGFPTSSLVASVKGGRPELQGTWIHPRLAVDLARWISPAFAVWMDGWFLETLSLPQAAPPRHEPQLPHLPPTGPAVMIRAADDYQARQIWLDTVWRSLTADKRPDYQRV